MTHQWPLQLMNLATGEIIAPLSQKQAQELTTYLELESPTDTSFYITPETIEFLRGQGAGELAEMLASALGVMRGIPVGYAPISETGTARVQGRVLSLESNSPLTGYKVEIYDEDVASDDLLGWCYSDSQGKFSFRFEESEFKELRTGNLSV